MEHVPVSCTGPTSRLSAFLAATKIHRWLLRVDSRRMDDSHPLLPLLTGPALPGLLSLPQHGLYTQATSAQNQPKAKDE